MKSVIYVILILSIYSCISPQGRNNKQGIESTIGLDSIAMTAYEYKKRGNEKDDLGDRQGAIDDYTQAIMMDSEYDTAYYNRALVKASVGDIKSAISDYSKAIKINNKFISAYINRANLKSDLGNKKGAIEDYTKVIELAPTDITAYLNRGATKYELQDYEGEIADYRLGIRLYRGFKQRQTLADLYNNLGRALYDQNRFKESAAAYGEGIKHFPNDYKLYYGRGLARNQSGDKNGACEDWHKSSELGCVEANVLLPLCGE